MKSSKKGTTGSRDWPDKSDRLQQFDPKSPGGDWNRKKTSNPGEALAFNENPSMKYRRDIAGFPEANTCQRRGFDRKQGKRAYAKQHLCKVQARSSGRTITAKRRVRRRGQSNKHGDRSSEGLAKKKQRRKLGAGGRGTGPLKRERKEKEEGGEMSAAEGGARTQRRGRPSVFFDGSRGKEDARKLYWRDG